MIRTSENIIEISKALVKFQESCPVVSFDTKNNFLGNKYASLQAIVSATKPHLAKNGLSVIQFITVEGVSTRILHESGEWIEGTTPMIELTDEKGKSKAQVLGSIITYIRRYSYSAALGVVSDEDTDGNNNIMPKPPQSANKPTKRLGQAEIERAEFLSMIKQDLQQRKSIDDIETYWTKNPSLHNDGQVKTLVVQRCKEIDPEWQPKKQVSK